MIISKEIKQNALGKIKDNWGKIIGIYMAFILISFVISIIESIFSGTVLSSFINIGATVVLIPLNFGFLINLLKFYKHEENIGAFDFFKNGFKNFGRAWGIWWFTFVKILPQALFVIVSYVGTAVVAYLLMFLAYESSFGTLFYTCLVLLVLFVLTTFLAVVWYICRSLFYVFADYVMIENPDLKPKEAVERSEAIMNGHRREYFHLLLSFIGWFLLCILSFCIGFIWIGPYFYMSKVAFYDELFKSDKEKTIE